MYVHTYMHAYIHVHIHTERGCCLLVLNLVTSTLTLRTCIHTYIHMNVIRSACSKVILIYRDVKTCTELCVIKCVHISQARLSAPAATLANTRRLQVSKECALCVFVSLQQEKH